MDAFERVVASLLERADYWVRPSYKVELTKQQKQSISRPSSPRWELDLVAYKGSDNSVLIVECKSYLDSRGVARSAFNGSNTKFGNRFKLFTDAMLRGVILDALSDQLVISGACSPKPTVQLCLAAGRIASDKDRKWLQHYFSEQGWLLWDEQWIGEELLKLSGGSYENDIAAVVAKLIHRNSVLVPTP